MALIRSAIALLAARQILGLIALASVCVRSEQLRRMHTVRIVPIAPGIPGRRTAD